ncbi:insulinase family protein [Candidatus Uhrbacteria bacterium]|nr:insulinase family protein [Candidatus Uhrbacteria bacterium]
MVHKATLNNNVRVILAPVPSTKSVTVEVWFGVGSRYEEKRINGISHFIEHMMFKGTKRRPSTLALSKELDAVGALYNAFTSKEVTGYWVKISADKLDLALDIVSDMLYHSKFEAKEVEREKSVICEEQHMHRDNPIIYIYDLLEEFMFSPSPLGWDIGGSDQVIHSLTREDLVRFRNSHYHGKNLIVGIAGNIDVDHARERVAHYFGTPWEGGARANIYKPYRRPTHKGPRVHLHYKDTEQVQVDFGFHGYAYTDRRAQTAALLGAILGGTMSSRLHIAIRERRGLCYSIRAGHESFQDAGIFYIQSGLEKSRAPEALRAILAELTRVRDKGVGAAELKRAKDNVKGRLALSWEDSENVVSWYVGQEHFTKKLLSPDEKLKKLYAITAEDIQRVAAELFVTKNINLAVIGPYKDAKTFAPLLRI